MGCWFSRYEINRKLDEGFSFLLCAINIYGKYDWVIPWNDEKGITITNTFQKILKESNRNPKESWVGKDSEMDNRSEKYGIEMYSKHNEGESVVGGRFIRTFRTKFYKYTASVSKKPLYWQIRWYRK